MCERDSLGVVGFDGTLEQACDDIDEGYMAEKFAYVLRTGLDVVDQDNGERRTVLPVEGLVHVAPRVGTLIDFHDGRLRYITGIASGHPFGWEIERPGEKVRRPTMRAEDRPVLGTRLPSGETWILPQDFGAQLKRGGYDLRRTLESFHRSGWLITDGEDLLAERVIDGRLLRAVVWRADAPPFP